MSLSPADWLGLPGGVSVESDPAALRWILLVLALVWAWLAGRDQGRGPSLGLGALFSFVATAFWISALGRPYGLANDLAATRRVAQIAVAAATGDAAHGPVADTPALSQAWAEAARALPEPAVALLPSVLPAVLSAIMAATILVLWGRRTRAPLAATLWLAFGTGAVDGLGERGFISGLWPRPEAGLLLAPAVAVVLAAARLRRRVAGIVACGAACGLFLLIPSRRVDVGMADLLRADLFDQGLFLWLGAIGLWRQRDRAALLLVVAGAALSALGLTDFSPEPWAAHALIRVGLLLAATEPIRDLLEQLGAWLAERARRIGWAPAGAALALVLAIAVPGSFAAWWRPVFQDAHYAASLEPVPREARAAAEWIRDHTPVDAVFAARPEHAVWIASLAGRRVIWSPSLGMPDGADRRRQIQRRALALEEPGQEGRAVGLSHVAFGPGAGMGGAATTSGPWRRVWDAAGWRVYEIGAAAGRRLE